MKPVPFIVTVWVAEPAVAEVGEMLVTVGTGLFAGAVLVVEMPPLLQAVRLTATAVIARKRPRCIEPPRILNFWGGTSLYPVKRTMSEKFLEQFNKKWGLGGAALVCSKLDFKAGSKIWLSAI